MSGPATPGGALVSPARPVSRPPIWPWQQPCADLALVATALAALSLFTVSSLLLEHFGFNYESPGGAPWEKVHPATLLIIGAIGLRALSAGNPLAQLSRLFGRDPWLLLFFLSVAITGAHAAVFSHLPFTGLIDTFVLPALILILFRGLDPRVARILAYGVCALMALNAVIGVLELTTGWRLLPLDVDQGVSADPTDTRAEFDWRAALAREWRATALLGHPLQNGVVTGAFILCLASPGARWLSGPARVVLIAASGLAMAAFGARAALAFTAGALALRALGWAVRLLLGAPVAHLRALAALCLGVPLAAAGAVVLFEGGFFDKLLTRFTTDQGSANARWVMWDMFDPLSWSDIVLGPDPRVVQTWQRLLGLEFGIESFWVGLPLVYGLLVSAILFIGLGLFVWRAIAASGPGATLVMGFFFAVASTSTGLSSKTTGLALVTVMLVLLLPPSGRGKTS